VITWDQGKRLITIKRHGIDLAGCEPFFDSRLITKEDDREVYGEQRLQSYGLLHGIVVLVVWVEREHGPHIVSARKAKRHERAYYFKTVRYD